MRKLVYECKKNGSVVKVASMNEADELRKGGWKVAEIFENIPEKVCGAPKQMAQRVKI